MHIVRYLFKHKLALLAVVVMFVLQAFCDLALPAYTSDIVDVGIQQSGIEDAVPEELSTATHEAILSQLSSGDAALFEGAYEFTDGHYVLKEDLSDRAALSALIEEPLIIAAGQTPAAEAGLRLQQAVEIIRAEYGALGVDMTDRQVDYLIHVGLLMMLMVALSCIFHIIMNFFATRTAATIARDLRSKLFNAVVSFSQREINTFSAASLITRGTNDIQLIQFASLMVQRMFTYSVIIAIGGVIRVAQTNVSMTWTIVLAVVAVLACMGSLVAITMPKFKIMQKLVDKVNLVSRESLTGVSVIRAFNRQAHEEGRFAEASGELMKTQLFTGRAMSLMSPMLMLIMNGVSVLIVWVGAHYVDLGTIQTGDLIAFITYAMTIISSFLMLGMMALMLPRAEVAAARVDEVIATATSIADPAAPKDAEFAATFGSAEEGVEIAFDDVTFGYPDEAAFTPVQAETGKRMKRKAKDNPEQAVERRGSEAVLEHISFKVQPGQTCAIVGGTGSGKSTLLKLLLRFYDVDGGAVRLNGIDVRDLTQETLHRTLAFVPQSTYLFAGDVSSKVGFGLDDVTDTEAAEAAISRALDLAQASGFVAEKEDGLHAEVAQGGTNFSGGQRQRLSIARALATDARGFLFDDSFSALDYKTDLALRTALNRDLSGRTMVIVAQRIATVMNADLIVVLDEGRVAGLGTHAQLLETCPAYREIALSQFSEAELTGEVKR